MKLIKTIIRVLLVLIILLLIAGVFLIRSISNRAVPDYNEDVSLIGLTGTVEVYRDQYGLPHIYAEDEMDLYRTCGYLQAQDRLWQMDLLRRVTTGRLSEILGEDMIDADQLFRSLRITEKSAIVMEKTDPYIIECLQAYSEGINQFIADNSGKRSFEFTVLGYEPEPWEVIHSFNLIGYMSWDLSNGWETESLLYNISRKVGKEKMEELIPDLDLHDAIFPEFMLEEDMELSGDLLSGSAPVKDLGLEIFHGSNNWVVDGKHSSTGKPIVSGDMHLSLDMAPGIWYQMHQVVPGELNVTGVVLPGAPFIICGHNDSIAWGMTNVSTDAVDFYIETINPDDSLKYLLDGEWKDINVEEEEILVKGGSPTLRVNQFTHRGPVVSSFKGIEDKVVSMRWIGNEFSNEMRTCFLLNHAANLGDFKDAVKTFISIGQNIVYGDVKGNIGLFTCGGIPIREGNRSFFVPGDTSLYDWKGMLPFEMLPHEVNPEKGFLVSANNRTTGPDYPYHISHWYSIPARFNRISELLSEKEVYSPEDMKKIQGDQVSTWAREFIPIINSQMEVAGLEGNSKAMYELFKGWDGSMDADLAAPAIFEAFYLKLVETVFRDELGEELFPEFMVESHLARYAFYSMLRDQDLSWTDNVNTEEKESLEDLILPAWELAARGLMNLMGDDIESWKWGDIHQISFVHAMGSVNILKKVFSLEKGPFRVGGSFHTVSPYTYSSSEPFNSNHGSSQRHIFPLDNWDNSHMIIPTGVSGIPASDFFCNQSEMYIENEYMPDLFSQERVIENSVFRSTYTGK
jgi:penicillin G amidase